MGLTVSPRPAGGPGGAPGPGLTQAVITLIWAFPPTGSHFPRALSVARGSAILSLGEVYCAGVRPVTVPQVCV